MRYIHKGAEPHEWQEYRKLKAKNRAHKNDEVKSKEQDQTTPGRRRNEFNDGPKDKLRTALVNEQGHLCYYCMARIEDDPKQTKIEHRIPISSKNAAPDNHLCYDNLFAVCLGGECASEEGSNDEKSDTKPGTYAHCDQSKQNDEISLDPSNKNIEQQIRYHFAQGTIEALGNKCAYCEIDPFRDRAQASLKSSKACAHCDLHVRLNLNWSRLRDNRKQVLVAFQEGFRKKYPKDWPVRALEEELKHWSRPKIRHDPQKGDGKYLEPYCGVIESYLRKKIKQHA